MYDDNFCIRALEFLREAMGENGESKLAPILADRQRAANIYAFIHWADMAGRLIGGDREVAGMFLTTMADRLDLRATLAHSTALSVAAADIRSGLENGTECQVCGQKAKEYRRKLNANMAIFMRSLVKAYFISMAKGGDGWIHHNDLEYTGRDYTMVAFFGLAKTQRAETDENGKRPKKTTGYWTPTSEGIDFVRGTLAVRKYVYMFNGSCREDTNSAYITFEQALGEKFVFSDLFAESKGENDGE